MFGNRVSLITATADVALIGQPQARKTVVVLDYY
jgi:hypothetical protein